MQRLLVGLNAWWVLSCLVGVALGAEVPMLVLKEQGVGSPVQAQPFVDKFVDIAAGANGWKDGAKGLYLTDRTGAEMFIANEKPHYGIMSLGAFLALRPKYKLEIVGQVDSTLIGGREYYIVSSEATDLAGCKKKVLASNHARDKRFAEKVVARGAFALSDFELLETARPLQTIRKVLSGDAACALIDDAQFAELPHIEGGAALKAVWTSPRLPPMVVAAFPAASAAERSRFRNEMAGICDGDDRKVCEEVGIIALKAGSDADYADVISAYGDEPTVK